MEMTTCGRCGRRLKNPDYIKIGYGRKCAVKMGITIPTKRKPKNQPVGQSVDQTPPGEEGR